MNIVKEYKDVNGLRLADLQRELADIQDIDIPTLSRIVSGVVRPNQKVEEYIASKLFQTGSNEGKHTPRINISTFDKNSLKSDFLIALYDEIAKGNRYKPITREEMCRALKVPDRSIRRGIEELRRAGVRVVSLSDRYGYWLNDDYIKFRQQMISKASTILKTVRAMDNVVEGQQEWQQLG